ncbi:heat shock protein [Biomphalaria glabrata]
MRDMSGSGTLNQSEPGGYWNNRIHMVTSMQLAVLILQRQPHINSYISRGIFDQDPLMSITTSGQLFTTNARSSFQQVLAIFARKRCTTDINATCKDKRWKSAVSTQGTAKLFTSIESHFTTEKDSFCKEDKSSKQKSVELSKHKDVFPQEIVIPTEVEHDKVSKNISCLDMISKNIPQAYFDQNDESLKAQETQQIQPDANISQMLSEPLKHGNLHDVIHIEESSLIDTSLLEWGIEEFNIDLASELEQWCQNTRHGIINDQKESFHQQNKWDQTKDTHSSSSIPQTVECQLFKGSINEDYTVSRPDSQQINVLEFDQISSPFDRDMPKSNACKNNNDSAYCSTSPSINSNEDIDWEELYDTILSLN